MAAGRVTGQADVLRGAPPVAPLTDDGPEPAPSCQRRHRRRRVRQRHSGGQGEGGEGERGGGGEKQDTCRGTETD